MSITLYTIGFTRSTAEHFFERLRAASVKRVLDIRLQNTSTLAGFTKREDLPYFLEQILGAAYEHEPRLSPTREMLKEWQAKRVSWPSYEAAFLRLLDDRDVLLSLGCASFEVPTALLCSEPTPAQCHRRLVAEHLQRAWPNLEIAHL